LTGGDFNGATQNHRPTTPPRPVPRKRSWLIRFLRGTRSLRSLRTHTLSHSHIFSPMVLIDPTTDPCPAVVSQSVTLDRSLVLFLCERRTVPPHHDQRPPRRRRRRPRRHRRHRQWECGSLVASMVAFIMTTPSSLPHPLLHRMQDCDDGDWPRPVVRLLEQGKGPLLAAAAAPDMESTP
jgi:hypothetical protein